MKNNGTLWGWGRNLTGQLGNGTTANTYTPSQSGTDSNWQKAYNGSGRSGGYRTDNSSWFWGNIIFEDTFSTVPLQVNCSLLAIDRSVTDNTVILSPNPTSGLINLQIPPFVLLRKVEVADQSGRIVSTFFGKQETLDIHSLSKGVYFISLFTDSDVEREKIVKL